MSRNSSEICKMQERKTIAATIGYCFVIVLVVLYVMSSTLTKTYSVTLESERGDAMKSMAVSCSTALSHTTISEDMTFPLPQYEYANGKNYTFDIYTKAGNSFLRLYTSSGDDSVDQYTLPGAGDEYVECYDQQMCILTTRTEKDVSYVCAIAPILSSENTVAGILEVRMPEADFRSTVNGMSLSWIFTIFSIAVSTAVIMFEFNLLISAASKGASSNMPLLIVYGQNASSVISFFASLGVVMQPIVLSIFFKESLEGINGIVVNVIIGVAILLFGCGFFGFTGIRKMLKEKLTVNVALISVTIIGYFLSLVVGLVNNPFVYAGVVLPIGFCCGMVFDSLRDYRINAGKLGYKGFDDRTIHNNQAVEYFLGSSVGAVIAGICYERFGIFSVALISGAIIVFTALGIMFFMKGNISARESYLPLNAWLETLQNKYTGKLMMSTFFVLGVIFAFLIGFVPNFLETVGISLATTSFYYLACAFSALFITSILKKQIDGILTSKIRVLISSASTILGFALFAVIPTAKILVITVVLLGVALGIHDFSYLYVLAKLSQNRIRCNLRKAAEMTFFTGILSAIPVFTLAFAIDNIRIVFGIGLVLLSIAALIYPLSKASNTADEIKRSSKNASPVNDQNSSTYDQTQITASPVNDEFGGN